MRLDCYLFQYHYVKSRQKAKELIESSNVAVNQKTICKPSYEMDENLEYKIVIQNPCPYVSRGGLKLEKILEISKIDVENKVALDIGASTGGFTDCLLQHGAKRVYALDSGTMQLDESLKNDSRVVSLENFNGKNISPTTVSSFVDIITIDVSFISQTLLIKNAVSVLSQEGTIFALIKPQFEVGKENIGKNGVVKTPKLWKMAIQKVLSSYEENGYGCKKLCVSPILGGDGNKEFLGCFRKGEKTISEIEIEQIIKSEDLQ